MVDEINISLCGIKKKYDRPILENICLDITNHSYIAVVGKSGSGKSTLMNILGLIENFDEGIYRFNDIFIRNERDYAQLRSKHIGFIFQSYNLIPTLTCIENIQLPLQYSKSVMSKMEEIFESLDILPLLNMKSTLLSGGEKQRVAIARSLILNPSLIIADEPTGNLDITNSKEVLRVLEEENKKGRAIVMITHSMDVALRAKKIYQLEKGILNEVKHEEHI